MSYCPNCGRQILDESLGCPVCNVRNNIDPTKKPVPTEQTDEYKEDNSFQEEAKAEQAGNRGFLYRRGSRRQNTPL